MGLRSLDDGYVPPILDVAKLDRKILVSNEESVTGLRELLDTEGIFGGVSAGAVAHVARRLAGELEEGVVVCILADGGWKYLSADFWEADDVDRVDGANRLVVIPAEVRAELRAHAEEEAPNEACGLVVAQGRRRRALRARPQRRRVAVPLRARGAARDVVPRGRGLTSSPSSTRTSPRRRDRRAPTSRTSGSGRASPT